MENKRSLKIIRILLQQQGYITIQEVADRLDVSNKTIRNDLKLIEDYVKDYQLFLRKKTGTGIWIEGKESQKLLLMESIGQKIHLAAGLSPAIRKVYIGLRLIACTENCRIYELASELYVSRATIHKDITALSERFHACHIRMVRKNNNGISLAGKERHFRDLMFDLMTEDPRSEERRVGKECL